MVLLVSFAGTGATGVCGQALFMWVLEIQMQVFILAVLLVIASFNLFKVLPNFFT